MKTETESISSTSPPFSSAVSLGWLLNSNIARLFQANRTAPCCRMSIDDGKIRRWREQKLRELVSR
jgi:hypothetical protein